MVLELLKKAEILTERDPAGRAATYNNLACYYRRQGKLHPAFTYLQKALKIESKLTNVQNPADTHINTCAVLSQLGRHQTAMEHAQSALILLQEELLSPPGVVGNAKPPQADRIAVLAIAYHNLGVEQEFLKRYEQSVLSYTKGVEVAERYLGPKHAICITLRNSLAAAKKSAAAAAYKSMTRTSKGSNAAAEAKKEAAMIEEEAAKGNNPYANELKKGHGRARSKSPDKRSMNATAEMKLDAPPLKAPSPLKKR
jgi:tetratricopeptide (TPR) repeat protein